MGCNLGTLLFYFIFCLLGIVVGHFTWFIKDYPSCNVSLGAFEKLKPFHVRRLRKCNTYTYKYYAEMVELLQGFNNMKTSNKGIHGRYCECDCDVCSSSMVWQFTIEQNQFLGSGDMWNSILCDVLYYNDWHNPYCLRGCCGECGLYMLITCPCEKDNF